MRWVLRFAVSAFLLWLLVSLLAAGYLGVTAGDAAAPKGLHFVQTGGYQTRYVQWGATGPYVVLVPGFLESADTWDQVAPLLARDHRVIAYDVAGFGYTQRTGPYGTEPAATQLLQLIAALHVTKPVLVGHSAGAAVIAAAALRAPGEVAGLVFLDGDGTNVGPGPRSWMQRVLVDPYRSALFRIGVRSDWFIRTVYRRQCGPSCPPLDAAGIQQWRLPLQQPGAMDALWSLAQAGGLGLPESELARLKPMTMPKTVVFGADDTVFGKDAPQQTAARIGAPAPTIIAGARHLTLISDPAAVAAAIEATAAR